MGNPGIIRLQFAGYTATCSYDTGGKFKMDTTVRKRLRETSHELSDSEISESGDGQNLKKKKKVYKQKFKEEWRKTFGKWLVQSANGKPRCSAYNKELEGSSTHIKRHADTKLHLSKLKDIETTPKLGTLLQKAAQNNGLQAESKSAELKMVMFLHEHNLPFLLMEHLPSFIQSICIPTRTLRKISSALEQKQHR